MNWIMIAVVVLAVEVVIVALMWDKITEMVASYPVLLEKGEKALRSGNLEKAKRYYSKLVNHRHFSELPDDNPFKMMAFKQLGTILAQLAQERATTKSRDHGVEYYQQAILYKIKELQLGGGEWDKLKENQPELKALKLKLAKAYQASNYNLYEALEICFVQGQWQAYLDIFHQYKKQLAFLNLPQDERDLITDKVSLAEGILLYQQGVKKILDGEDKGKLDVDEGLELVSEVLNHYDVFLQIDEPIFNEVKEKLGIKMLEDIQQAEGAEEVEPSEPKAEKEQQGEEKSDWKNIVDQLQKQSRIVAHVTEKPGEVNIEVMTEWYLLPLIFQEELVERMASTYYKVSRKKQGSLFVILRDNKGREVARHTQLGVRVYN